VRTILATFLILLLLIPVSTFGEVQTITHTVKQPFGGSQSADDARIAAVAKAQREALEMAGVYIEALTIVKDAKVDRDEILALTAGVLKSEVVSQKNYVIGEGFGIEVVVKIIVDPSVLESRVKKLLRDRTYLEQLNQARKKETELLDKLAILEKENRSLMAEKKSSVGLQKQFHEVTEGLTAAEWYKKSLALMGKGGNYTVAIGKTAVEYLNQAIRLNPDFAEAYAARGFAHLILGQHKKELDDYNEAIRLKPDYAQAYMNRGTAYDSLGQYQKAIIDYTEAIRLTPNADLMGHSFLYANRGALTTTLVSIKMQLRIIVRPSDCNRIMWMLTLAERLLATDSAITKRPLKTAT